MTGEAGEEGQTLTRSTGRPAIGDRSTATQSRLIGLLLGLGLAVAVGAAYLLATDRAADTSRAQGPNGATLEIVDCPTEIVLNTSPLCGIVTSGVVEAVWEIEGFGSGPVEKVDTEWQMFINPTNSDVSGLEFLLVVTALGRDGNELQAQHRFRVVE